MAAKSRIIATTAPSGVTYADRSFLERSQLCSARRVVVTGMGVVSPLGVGNEPAWWRLTDGRSGIRRLPDDLVPDVAAKIGGVVPTVAEDPDADSTSTLLFR